MGSYLEEEIVLIAESVGHPLDDFDLVIDAFEDAGMDGKPAMGEYTVQSFFQGAGKALEGLNA